MSLLKHLLMSQSISVPTNAFRKSHEINGSTEGEQTDYQVMIKTVYSEPEPEFVVQNSQSVSGLPQPDGTTAVSAQAAIYWDGTNLHVWYGARGAGDHDDIFYTKSSDFESWDTPVKVIDHIDTGDFGVRDPTSFIEGDTIYFFIQCGQAAEDDFYPVRLFKIAKTDDFTDSEDYTNVGVVVTIGADGEYDESYAASPCVVKIDDTYWLLYEAKEMPTKYTIGRASTTDLESLPWTKDGQLRDTGGAIIYNPTSTARAIVPETFANEETAFIHYYDDVRDEWHSRYLTGDVPANSMTLCDEDIDPPALDEAYNIAWIGEIDENYYFLVNSAEVGGSTLFLYRQGDIIAFLEERCRTDFGDIRFRQGVTKLDYWIEDKVDEDYAVFWVKIPTIPVAGTEIHIYYGKTDETSESSGADTFETFDDFEDADVTDWADNGADGTFAASTTHKKRGSYSGKFTQNVGVGFVLTKDIALALGKCLTFDFRDDHTKIQGGGLSGLENQIAPDNRWAWMGWYSGDSTTKYTSRWRVDAWSPELSIVTRITDWHKMQVYVDQDGNIKFIIDNEPAFGENNDIFTAGAPPNEIVIGGINPGVGGPFINYFDDFRLRKYIDPEPTHSIWGNEEPTVWPF